MKKRLLILLIFSLAISACTARETESIEVKTRLFRQSRFLLKNRISQPIFGYKIDVVLDQDEVRQRVRISSGSNADRDE